jgi:tRNA (cytidine/uridine-2'-O-)-methyltransferase
MFEVVLFEPEIPPNTGNIMRLCANAGARLHLIEPLGFSVTDRRLRRAGLDYAGTHPTVVHRNLGECEQMLVDARWHAVSTRGQHAYDSLIYRPGDVFVFGPETRGLPESVLEHIGRSRTIRIPMVAGSRSLNLANAVAIVLYEAWRQSGYRGSSPPLTGQGGDS